MQTVLSLHYSAYSGVQRQSWRLKPLQVIWAVGLLAVSLNLFIVAREVSSFLSPFVNTAQNLLLSATTTPIAHAEAAAPAATVPAQPVPSLPPTSATPDASAAVTAALQAALQQNSAQTWSVAVYDIKAGRWLAQVNADKPIGSASLYKLYATYAAAQTVPFDQWATHQVAGHSLKDCIDLMLRMSDNVCGEAVGNSLGWSRMDRTIHKYGFAQTVLNGRNGPMTTAANTASLMSDLYQGKLFDQPTTAFVLNSLQHQKYRSAIPAGCAGCSVYNKTGNSSSVSHDSAIVQSGQWNYAVTIMSQGGSYAKIANLERALESALHSLD